MGIAKPSERWKQLVLARRRQARRQLPAGVEERASREHRVYARRLQALVQEWEPAGLLVDLLKRHVGPDATVIDIGAGTGRYTLPVARWAREVIAVEPSPVMSGYLRENLARRGIDNVMLVARRWEVAEVAVADFAVCSHVLYDVLEIDAFLRKMDELARHGCFIVHHREQFDLIARRLWPLVHGEERAPMPMFDLLLEVLNEIGVSRIQEGRMPSPFRVCFDSSEEVIEYGLETLMLEDSLENRAWLSEKVVSLVEQAGGYYYMPSQQPSGVVWWLK